MTVLAVVPNAFARLIQTASFAEEECYDCDDVAKSSLTLKAFLEPPAREANPAYEAYLRRQLAADAEATHEQHEHHQSKKDVVLFTGGRMSGCRDIATGIANFLGYVAWFLGTDPTCAVPSVDEGGPVLYGWLKVIFNALIHPQTKKWEEKFLPSAPHLPHLFFTSVDQILRAIFSRALDPDLQLLVAQQEAGFDVSIPSSAFSTVGDLYKDFVAQLKKAVKGKSLAAFSTPHADYVPPTPKDLGKPRKGRTDDDGGDRDAKKAAKTHPSLRQGWLGSVKVCHPPADVLPRGIIIAHVFDVPAIRQASLDRLRNP